MKIQNAVAITAKKYGYDFKTLFGLATKGGCASDADKQAVRMVHALVKRQPAVATETEQA